jgi:hypothetical protein
MGLMTNDERLDRLTETLTALVEEWMTTGLSYRQFGRMLNLCDQLGVTPDEMVAALS